MSEIEIVEGSKARFGRFNVDLGTGKLQRSGLNVSIQAKPFGVLRLLLIANGNVVSRDKLRAALWPQDTFVDFEHGLNTAVRKLRQALEDSADNPKFIETLPRLGYRFKAAVEWAPDEPARSGKEPAAAETPAGSSPSITLRHRVVKIGTLVAAIFILASASLWFTQRSRSGRSFFARVLDRTAIGDLPPAFPAFKERPLTANPEDTPVTSAVLSPDGKYLAYTDATGFYLRDVDSGETHVVPLEKGFEPLAESWFPDRSHLVVSWTDDPQRQPSLWKMSVLGGPAQRLSEAGYGAAVSPDGSRILYIRRSGPAEEVWLIAADASHAEKVLGSLEYSFGQISWAPHGDKFAYARTRTRYYTMRSGADTQIDIFDLHNRTTTVVEYENERGLPRGGAAVAYLPDDRLLYPRREPRPNQQDTNLWWVRLDPQTSQPVGNPTRLTSGHGIAVQVSVTAEGTRIALRKHAPQDDIFIADVGNNGELRRPQRLTLDERLDYATAWTGDSDAVVFYSNRNGPFHIFKQGIQSAQPVLLVGGLDDLYAPRMTPDQSAVLYIVRAPPNGTTNEAQLMRIPVVGGISQPVLKASGLWDAECARVPSGLCIYSTICEGKQVFYKFNPENGKVTGFPGANLIGNNFNWILAPDGMHAAWATQPDSSGQIGIRILTISNASMRDIAVPGWADLYGVDWADDSRSLWVAARNSAGSSAILHVLTSGKVIRALDFKHQNLDWVIPSPDGKRLAVVLEMNRSNVSLIDNF
jgi:DNA-binding winged helix-turn-helix (wHTH) protein/Tol biopolymer transport system component